MASVRFGRRIRLRCCVMAITLLLSAFFMSVKAQYNNDDRSIVTNRWNTYAATTEGTEFWVTFMFQKGQQISSTDLDLMLYATSQDSANITVSGIYTYTGDKGSKDWKKEMHILKGGKDSIMIPPQVAYLEQSNSNTDEFKNKGLRVISDKPISLYAINANTNSYDGTLIYPSTYLGTEYIIQTYHNDDQSTEFAIVSTQDNNEITISLADNNYDIDYEKEEIEYKEDTTIILNAGQTWGYYYQSSEKSLSGTKICSKYPIAVFQGGQLSKVASGNTLSHIYHQATSVDNWGRDFFVSRTSHFTYDVVRITASEDDTQISKNGTVVATISKNKTYEEEIFWPVDTPVINYKTSKASCCYLYATDYSFNSYGSPALSPITPTEYGLNKIVLTPFNETRAAQLKMSSKVSGKDTLNKYYKHYANIILPSKCKEYMKLDGTSITDFTDIPNTDFSFSRVNLSDSSHILSNDLGLFTVRIYGIYERNQYDGPDKALRSLNQHISYAYSGGSSVLHPMWMLLDGQRVKEKAICLGEKIDLESVVQFDYDSLQWKLTRVGNTDNADGSERCEKTSYTFSHSFSEIEKNQTKAHLMDYLFQCPGKWEVSLIVGRKTLVCENFIRDTVRAIVKVNDTVFVAATEGNGNMRYVCDNSRTDTLVTGKDGNPLYRNNTKEVEGYKTDTMKLDRVYTFIDRQQTAEGCKQNVEIKVQIVPNPSKPVTATVCANQLPFVWTIYDEKNSKQKTKIVGDDIDTALISYPYQTSYYDTTLTKYGCESYHTLLLTVNEVKNREQTITICQDELPYKWQVHSEYGGKEIEIKQDMITLGEEKEFRDTLHVGCDQIEILHLTVYPSYMQTDTVVLCEGQSFKWTQDRKQLAGDSQPYGRNEQQWKDTTIISAGTYKREYKTEHGCSDIRTLEVVVNPAGRSSDSVVLCQKELPYSWVVKEALDRDSVVKTIPVEGWGNDTYFTSYQKPYIVQDTVTVLTINDCDSVVTRRFIIHPQYKIEESRTICGGDYTEWEGEQVYGKVLNRTQAEGSDFFGKKKYEDYDYEKRYTTSGGCDSIRILHLTVNPRKFEYENVSGCEPYTYIDFLRNEKTLRAGMKGDTAYFDTLKTKTEEGCEYIRLRRIDVYKVWNINKPTVTITDTEGKNYKWQGETHHLPVGTHTLQKTYQTRHGCDSTINITVIVQQTYNQQNTATICENEQPYIWSGHSDRQNNPVIIPDNLSPRTYNYSDNLKTAEGQDSIWHLQLTVYPVYDNQPIVKHLCYSEGHFEWRRENADETIEDIPFDFDAPPTGHYVQIERTRTLKTVHNCDSTIHLQLYVYPSPEPVELSDNLCETEDKWWEWVVYSADGLENKTLTIPSGDRNKPFPHTYTLTHTFQTRTPARCDSTVTLKRTILPVTKGQETITICRSELPYWYNNHEFKSAVERQETHPEANIYGCDSICYVTLRVLDSKHSYDTINLCDFESDTSYIDYVPNGNPVTYPLQEGDNAITLSKRSSVGCDSIVHIRLNKWKHSENELSVAVCDNELPWIDNNTGKEFYRDTVFTDTLTNYHGCDSLLTVTFKVNPTDYHLAEVTVCESNTPYSYSDTRYTKLQNISKPHPRSQEKETVEINDTVLTSEGCIDVVALRLTILPTLYTTVELSLCPEALTDPDKPYVYESINQKSLPADYKGGTIVEKLESQLYDCDSIVTYNIQVSNRDTISYIDDICEGVPYEFDYKSAGYNDYDGTLKDLHISGDYYDVIPANGTNRQCEQVVKLSLVVYPAYSTPVDTTKKHICENETYTFFDGTVYNANGEWLISEQADGTKHVQSYLLEMTTPTVNGCDSAIAHIVYVHPTYYSESADRVCQYDTYDWTRGDKQTDLLPLMVWDVQQKKRISRFNIPTNRIGDYTYIDSLTTRTCSQCQLRGCDSIIVLHLTIDSVYRDTTSHTMSDEQTYLWQDTLYIGCKVNRDTIDTNRYPYITLIPEGKIVNAFDVLSYRTVHGCDSTFRLELKVGPTFRDTIVQYKCDNETYDWYRIDNRKVKSGLSSPGLYYDSLLTVGFEFDSILVLDLRNNPTYEYSDTDTVCQVITADEPYYLWNGHNSGSYHLVTADGRETAKEKIEISSAGQYLYKKYYTTKTYNKGFDENRNEQDIQGCDSVWYLHLLVTPTYRDSIVNDTICQNEYYLWQDSMIVGDLYTGSVNQPLRATLSDGDYTFTNRYGTYFYQCDSTCILHLHIRPTYTLPVKVENDTICDTDIYTLFDSQGKVLQEYNRNGEWVVSTHNEYDTIINRLTIDTLVRTTLGCDSVILRKVAVFPAYEIWQDSVICQDSTKKAELWYNLHGNPLNRRIDISEPTDSFVVYRDTLPARHGCDSVFCLRLTVHPSYYFYEPYTICATDTFSWHGRYYRGAGFITDDHYALLEQDSCLFCLNDNYLTQDTVFRDTIFEKTTHGCDSIYYLTLTINHSGIYYDTLPPLCSADSIYEFHYHNNAEGNIYHTDTFRFHPVLYDTGQVIIRDTVFSRHLQTVNGCDSLVEYALYVYPSYVHIDTAKICWDDSFQWHSTAEHLDSMYYTDKTQEIFSDPHLTYLGCDSVFYLSLYVYPVVTNEIFGHVCENQFYIARDTIYLNPDSSKYTVEQYELWSPNQTVSPSDLAIGEYHYKRNDDTLHCDTIVAYYIVSICPTYEFNDTVSVCSDEYIRFLHKDSLAGYTPVIYNRHDYIPPKDTTFIDTCITRQQAKIGRDIVVVNNGKRDTITTYQYEDCSCDSVYVLHATIHPAYHFVEYDTICSNEVYYWHDRSIAKQGGDTVCFDSLTTRHYPCDSIYELRLHIRQAYDYSLTHTMCVDELPYINENISVTYPQLKRQDTYSSFDSTYHFFTYEDCDSIIHLHLNVLDTTYTLLFDTICLYDRYYPTEHDTLAQPNPNLYYDKSGFYIEHTLNKWNCRHTIYTRITVIPPTTYTLYYPDICADEQELNIHYTYHGRYIDEFSVYFDTLGHEQGFKDIVHLPVSDPQNQIITIPVPHGEVLPMPHPTYFETWNGVEEFVEQDRQQYPRPNRYAMRIVLHNGYCNDSLQGKDTTLNIFYPSWIHEQHWNDGILLYNDIYNGGYQFSHYQWYYNDQPIPGQTREFLYLPDSLHLNWNGDIFSRHCRNEYKVQLTREDDGYTTFTCPICPILIDDHIVPQKEYFSIVPTLVIRSHPVVWILTTEPGYYWVYSMSGALYQTGRFYPDNNNYGGSITLPDTERYVIVKLCTDNGDCRSFEILIANE